MEGVFHELCDRLFAGLRGEELLLCGFYGEHSDFSRFSRGRIRQAGHVEQYDLELELIRGRRHVRCGLRLSGDPGGDRARAGEMLREMRETLRHVPEDPYLCYATEPVSTRTARPGAVPGAEEVFAALHARATDLDTVGIWAGGSQYHGFANSLGQRNWHQADSYNLDWSCCLEGDTAVKRNLSGHEWQSARLDAALASAREELLRLARPSRAVSPGRHRVYLAPAAMRELFALLSWDGFDARAHRTGETPLVRMVREGLRLSPAVSVYEDHERGLAPGFGPSGHRFSGRVPLIEQGSYREPLVDPRAAAEYGLTVNSPGPAPRALDFPGGSLDPADAAAAVGDGLWIGNLWYCNYSDRGDARMTGVTRYACFRIEHGRLGDPVAAMRFDDSLLELLGPRLEALTPAESALDPDTYHRRSVVSWRIPGAVVDGLEFTS